MEPKPQNKEIDTEIIYDKNRKRITAYEAKRLMPFASPYLDEIDEMIEKAAKANNNEIEYSTSKIADRSDLMQEIIKDLQSRGFSTSNIREARRLKVSWKN